MNLEGLPYVIDRMQPKDVYTVSSIEHRVFTLPWSTAAFRHEVSQNSLSVYLVLRYLLWMQPAKVGRWSGVQRLVGGGQEDPSLLGYGGFWMMGNEAHICTLALRPEWRGRGLGELLLATLIEQAHDRNLRTVSLEVRVTNSVAQNLYLKYGFRTLGRKKGYYTDNREDAYDMVIDNVLSPEYEARFQELGQRLYQRLLAEPQPPPVSPVIP
ncbi:MAG TPA: ribosomal protein S18-alanine N-acetyltransferase [Chloroflexi bacterium]|jgi:ribosomal-protein-alanine N-acetyltransferase|nr:ribosomal protein S18-alanine N-acetyltransferase [Chloroflexota bacterium]